MNRWKRMSRWQGLLLVLFLTVVSAPGTCRAEDEFIGTVTDRSSGHLSVRLPNGDTRRVRISESTRFFNEGNPAPRHRILPHSVVRVAPRDGAALVITILGAPT